MPRTQSYDSGMRPLSDVRYQHPNESYQDLYKPSSGFYPPQKNNSSRRKWVIIGVIVLVIVIAAAVVGGVVASRKASSAAASSSSSGGGSGGGGGSSASAGVGRFPSATDTWGLPIYPTETNSAVFSPPTFVPQGQTTSSQQTLVSFPPDPFQPTSPSPTTTRPDRPRLLAPSYKWDALPALIAQDPYLAGWNSTIFGNATYYYGLPLTNYSIDGGYSGSGVLDVAREIKVRIKTWAYVYRMTNQTEWVDRAWLELVNAAGNNSATFFGEEGNNWNYYHFLDVGEFTAAFAIAYDWLYDVWTDQQREALMYSIIDLGLTWGLQAYNNQTFRNNYGWWNNGVNGNWNCVCNGGLTLGALAILGDDTSGMAEQILALTVPNAASNCAQAPSSDGTWSETANYWYFGTTGHAEMTSALMTATGSDYGLLTANPEFNMTGLYHMYVWGMTSLFNYGDHGPNKYSTTANGMLFYGTQYDMPIYTLFQRDMMDAAEPWSMFWYNGTVSGAWWNGLPLDHYFDNGLDQWASMRSSWTDDNGLYVAMKSGNHTGHQTHGDLDAGDFVLDAMGQRWAGELGSGNYLSTGYFSSEGQNSQRWLYYRKRTEGQNTVVVNWNNQNADAQPSCQYQSTGEEQDYTTTYQAPQSSTAYFTTDLTSSTNDTTSFTRGVRLLNGRKQVLIQDDIVATAAVQWRMHTNATITYSADNLTATLTLDGQTCLVQLLNVPTGTGATFQTLQPVRYTSDPPLPPGEVDQPNDGVSVLSVTFNDGGSYSIQVLFSPQWPGMSASDFVTPPNVPLSQWSLTSHN